MRKNLNLVCIVAGFTSAIFISSFHKLGFSFFLFLLFISIALFIFQKFLAVDANEKKNIFLLALFFLSFGLGVLRYEIRDIKNLNDTLEKSVGQKVLIDAVIVDEPSQTESQTRLIVDFKDILVSGSSTPVSGKGIVSTSLSGEFRYGDLVHIEGKLEKPTNFISTSSNDFDYISYLGKDDIFYTMSFTQISILSHGHGNPIQSILFSIKNAFIDNIGKIISEPEASLLGGILLGAKSSINKDLQNIFRIAGLSHIIALSGYNITVVADAISKSLLFLPKMYSLYAGIFGIILFVIMSGGSSTAVRAGIMALIAILGKITRRKYSAGRALVVAALIMIIVNPKILVFDISFQLSFLATIAIIYVSPILNDKFTFITERFGLRNNMSSVISAQILVLPLILYKMGLLSLVALPANILVLPLMPATMFFGFITGVCAFISVYLALPFAWISWFLLFVMIKVATFFAFLPFSSVTIHWFSPTVMIVCYVCIIIWIYYEHIRLVARKK